MTSEEGLSVDEDGFEACMLEQKERARKDRRAKQQIAGDEGDWLWLDEQVPSDFVGYETLSSGARVIGVKQSGGKLQLVLDRTPFYAESGGQTGDKGFIEGENLRVEVIDTQKDGELIVHVIGKVFDRISGEEIDPSGIDFRRPVPVNATVDRNLREATERNHTATHLMHAALRKVLGEHVQQKGSLVGPDRLRFDFSHFEKMTARELEAVEAEVNERIREAADLVKLVDVPYEEAIEKGALAFFGDKYADRVRVVEVPGVSVELCGGTHVSNAGKIGLFKIVSESSIASGIRRVEAITGRAAEELLWKEFQELQEVRHLLKTAPDESVAARLQEVLDERKSLDRELQDIKLSVLLDKALKEAENAETLNGCRIFVMNTDDTGSEGLRSLAQYLRQKIGNCVGLLAGKEKGKVTLVGFAGDEAISTFSMHAGELVKKAAAMVQGGGGGKPGLATAGGRNPEGIPEAIRVFRESVMEKLQ